MNNNEINDYASFLKAKKALEKEIEFHLSSTADDLQDGFHNINMVKMAKGFASNLASNITDKLDEKIMGTKTAQKINEVISIASFVKDMFKK